MPYNRIYPRNYLQDLEIIKSNLRKPAELPIYNSLIKVFLNANQKFLNHYNEPFDYESNKGKYQRGHRYFTGNMIVKQPEFDGLPAAKINTSSNRFDVLSEGPTEDNFPELLKKLRNIKISTLVAVGEAQNGDKFYNYISQSQQITFEDFYINSIKGDNNVIPEELLKAAKETKFRFSRYSSKESGDFYVLHIPNWEDFGLPTLTDADKIVLGYFFEFGPDACYHCSAGQGRSVALMQAKMFYKNLYKTNDKVSEADVVNYFQNSLEVIKSVKPNAVNATEQALFSPGLAEDSWELVGNRLKFRSLIQSEARFFGNSNPTGYIAKMESIADNEMVIDDDKSFYI